MMFMALSDVRDPRLFSALSAVSLALTVLWISSYDLLLCSAMDPQRFAYRVRPSTEGGPSSAHR